MNALAETEQEKVWRYLNRTDVQTAIDEVVKFFINNRNLELQLRKEEMARCFDEATRLQKYKNDSNEDAKAYEEEFAKAWAERAMLKKNEKYPASFIEIANDHLMKEVGWSIAEIRDVMRSSGSVYYENGCIVKVVG